MLVSTSIACFRDHGRQKITDEEPELKAGEELGARWLLLPNKRHYGFMVIGDRDSQL